MFSVQKSFGCAFIYDIPQINLDFENVKKVNNEIYDKLYKIVLEDGKELLIPAIKECILNVDVENKKMEVHVMEGLRD